MKTFEDVWKTSFVFGFRRRPSRRLSYSASEDVLKTSSRRLDQDEYICLSHMSSEDVLIETNIFILVICLQDVFKTSWKNVFKTFSRRLQDVLKTSSRHLQDTFKTSWQDVFKTSSKCYQEILQKRLQDILKTSCKDIFKTFSRRIIKLNCSC